MNIRGDILKIDTRDVIEELDKRLEHHKMIKNEYEGNHCASVLIKEQVFHIAYLTELKDIFISIENNLKEKQRKYMCDAYSDLDNNVVSEFDLECKQCGHKFLEKDAYNWRINNRIVLCCPNCKAPSLFSKED